MPDSIDNVLPSDQATWESLFAFRQLSQPGARLRSRYGLQVRCVSWRPTGSAAKSIKTNVASCSINKRCGSAGKLASPRKGTGCGQHDGPQQEQQQMQQLPSQATNSGAKPRTRDPEKHCDKGQNSLGWDSHRGAITEDQPKNRSAGLAMKNNRPARAGRSIVALNRRRVRGKACNIRARPDQPRTLFSRAARLAAASSKCCGWVWTGTRSSLWRFQRKHRPCFTALSPIVCSIARSKLGHPAPRKGW